MLNSKKTISVWANALFSAFAGKTEKEKREAIWRLAEILKKKKKERFLLQIVKKAEKIQAAKNTIELVLAREQDGALVHRIEKKVLEIFGRDKEIKEIIDPELIAGFRARTEGLLLKASVKDFLDKFKNSIA